MNIRTPLPLIIPLLLLTNQASFANTDDSEWQELLKNVQLKEHIDNAQNSAINQKTENLHKNNNLTSNETDNILTKFAQKKR